MSNSKLFNIKLILQGDSDWKLNPKFLELFHILL